MGMVIAIKKPFRSLSATGLSRIDNDQPNAEGVDFHLFQRVGMLNLPKFFIPENWDIVNRAIQLNGKAKRADKNIDFHTGGEKITDIPFGGEAWKIGGDKVEKIFLPGAPVVLIGSFMLIIIAHCATAGTKLKFVLCQPRRGALDSFPTPPARNYRDILFSFKGDPCAFFGAKFKSMITFALNGNLDMMFRRKECLQAFAAL